MAHTCLWIFLNIFENNLRIFLIFHIFDVMENVYNLQPLEAADILTSFFLIFFKNVYDNVFV